MKIALLTVLICFLSIGVFGQSDLQKLVDTENAFAQAAAEKGTRTAFLAFLADDSIVFNPQRSNGKEVWTARKESPAFLSWYPAFADISGNGLIGYTTGPWEYRPKGKDDAPAAFGHYMTIWQKQLDGNFKAVLDFGISHDRSTIVENKLTSVPEPAKKGAEVKSYAGDSAAKFFEMIADERVEKAYKMFAADDIHLMREGRMPLVGKKAALEAVGDLHGVRISKRTSFYGSDDIAYMTNTYSIPAKEGKVGQTGNLVQIWKNRGGKWLIVMDVFVADPK